MAEQGIRCSLSRAGNVWDNAAMESFFSSLKTERTAGKTYRSQDAARADVFDYIERFYNPRRRHSTLGYLSPVAYEERMRLLTRHANTFILFRRHSGRQGLGRMTSPSLAASVIRACRT